MWAVAWVACTDPKPPPVPGVPTDTGTVPDTVVDSPSAHSAFATVFEARCGATNNPLRFVCTLDVDPPQGVEVRFRRADGSGEERRAEELSPSASHAVPLYFLAPETEYTWVATTLGTEAPPVSGSFVTGAVPEDHAAKMIVTGVSSTPYLGGDHACGTGATASVFDTRTGELVWYQVASLAGNFGGMEMVTFTAEHTVLGVTRSEVMEYDPTGAELRRWTEGVEYLDDLHHDLFRWNDLYYLLFRRGTSPALDGFVVLDPSGVKVAEWFSGDSLALPADAAGDFLHTNTIRVDAGVVTLSSYSQHTVFQVDGDPASPTFGEPGWFLRGSDSGRLGSDFAIDWSAVGGVDQFSRQHHANYLPDGRMILLDNDHGRALVLRLDPTAGTAVVEESYPTSQSLCGPQGTATVTAAGNFVVACSGMLVEEFEPLGTSPVFTGTVQCSTPPLGSGGVPGTSRWYPLEDW